MQLDIVIPCFNEEEVLLETAKRVSEVLKGIIDCDYGFSGHNKVSIDFIRSNYFLYYVNNIQFFYILHNLLSNFRNFISSPVKI